MKSASKKYWFIHFLRRLSLFLFLIVTILVLLFMLGNFQDFLDSTLQTLLRLIETSAMIGGVVLFFLLSVSLLFGIMGRELSIPIWLTASAGMFVIVVLIFFIKFLKVWLYTR